MFFSFSYITLTFFFFVKKNVSFNVAFQTTNAIYFLKNGEVLIQLCSYKNSDKQGCKMLQVPSLLSKKLVAYVSYVRPLLGKIVPE